MEQHTALYLCIPHKLCREPLPCVERLGTHDGLVQRKAIENSACDGPGDVPMAFAKCPAQHHDIGMRQVGIGEGRDREVVRHNGDMGRALQRANKLQRGRPRIDEQRVPFVDKPLSCRSDGALRLYVEVHSLVGVGNGNGTRDGDGAAMRAAQLARALELRQVRPSRNRRDAKAVADIGNLQRASVVHLVDNHRAALIRRNPQRFLRARLPHGQPPMPRCSRRALRRQRPLRNPLAAPAASRSPAAAVARPACSAPCAHSIGNVRRLGLRRHAHRLVLRWQHLCLIMARERHGPGFA